MSRESYGNNATLGKRTAWNGSDLSPPRSKAPRGSGGCGSGVGFYGGQLIIYRDAVRRQRPRKSEKSKRKAGSENCKPGIN